MGAEGFVLKSKENSGLEIQMEERLAAARLGWKGRL